MKNYLSLLLLSMPVLALSFASCVRSEDGRLDVDTKSLVFTPAGAADQTVNVTAENVGEWRAELNDPAVEWLHIEKVGNTVTVTVDDNNGVAERTAKFTVKSNTVGAPMREVAVTQMGVGISVGVTVSVDMTFSMYGGTQFMTVTAQEGIEWDAAITEGGGDWIGIEKSAGGISVTVTANGTADVREAKLTVTADGVDDIVVNIKQEGIPVLTDTFTVGLGSYIENYYGEGHDRFVISLSSAPIDEEGYIIGPGMALTLDIVAPRPASIVYPELPSGIYTFTRYSDNPDNYTVFTNTDYTNLRFYELFEGDKEVTEVKALKVVSGSFTVTRDGDNYIMDFDMMLNDGSAFRGSYNGAVEITNPRIVSTLREDVDFGTISEGGTLLFNGDAAGNGTYNWATQMWGPGVYVNSAGEFAGSGVVIILQYYTDQSSTQALAPGTYNLEYLVFKSFTARPGYTYYGEMRGGWYIEIVNGLFANTAPLMSGNIAVSGGTDNNYTVEFNTRDDIANSITGTYEGTLRYYDMSKAPQPNGVEVHFRPTSAEGHGKTKIPAIDSHIEKIVY